MDLLILPVVTFGLGAIAGAGVLVLAWPLLAMREHRRRVIAMLALVTVLVACMMFGQFLLDGLASWCAPRPGATCR